MLSHFLSLNIIIIRFKSIWETKLNVLTILIQCSEVFVPNKQSSSAPESILILVLHLFSQQTPHVELLTTATNHKPPLSDRINLSYQFCAYTDCLPSGIAGRRHKRLPRVIYDATNVRQSWRMPISSRRRELVDCFLRFVYQTFAISLNRSGSSESWPAYPLKRH